MKRFLTLCVMVAASATAQDQGLLDRARAALREAPHAPPGYDTPQELQAAVKAGEILALGPDDAAAWLREGVVVERDLEYGVADGISLTLDLFRPGRMHAPAPMLIYIHGGGWIGKGKDFCTYWCARYAAMGYVCATVEYRTSNEAIYPAAIQDVNCAIRWMRANATNYNADPYKIALVGQSAGAHLALMAAYTDDEQFQGDCGMAGVSGAVQAVVEYYGPVDMTLRQMVGMGDVQRFLGATFGEAPERYKQASPVEHVSSDDPPTLIFHGTIDGVVGIAQADILAETLESAGVPYVYDRIEGWDHVMEMFKKVNEHCMAVQDGFLATYLPLPPPPPVEVPATVEVGRVEGPPVEAVPEE